MVYIRFDTSLLTSITHLSVAQSTRLVPIKNLDIKNSIYQHNNFSVLTLLDVNQMKITHATVIVEDVLQNEIQITAMSCQWHSEAGRGWALGKGTTQVGGQERRGDGATEGSGHGQTHQGGPAQAGPSGE